MEKDEADQKQRYISRFSEVGGCGEGYCGTSVLPHSVLFTAFPFTALLLNITATELGTSGIFYLFQ